MFQWSGTSLASLPPPVHFTLDGERAGGGSGGNRNEQARKGDQAVQQTLSTQKQSEGRPKVPQAENQGRVRSIRPDPEVVDKPVRRQFTAAYKLQVLREADACAPGEVGALLRREGL